METFVIAKWEKMLDTFYPYFAPEWRDIIHLEGGKRLSIRKHAPTGVVFFHLYPVMLAGYALYSALIIHWYLFC